MNRQGIRSRLALHLLIWVIYSVIYLWVAVPSFSIPQSALISILSVKLSHIPFIAIAVYINFFLLVPQLLLKKKYVLYALFALVFWGYALGIHGFVNRFASPVLTAMIFGIIRVLGLENGDEIQGIVIRTMSPSDLITDVFVALLVSTVICILMDRYQREKDAQALEHAKLQSELQFLRSQIQPHFFMNTLNNLYGMILPLSQKAAGHLMGLAELMRYILYETTASRVPLSNEVSMLKSYVELETMRLGEDFQVNFNTASSLEGFEIAPMLLIVFIENSFKHGAYETIKGGWLEVYISTNDHHLTFKVENSMNTKSNSQQESHGIGLDNVKKRLELLYPEKHELSLYQEESSFLVTLNLSLK